MRETVVIGIKFLLNPPRRDNDYEKEIIKNPSEIIPIYRDTG